MSGTVVRLEGRDFLQVPCQHCGGTGRTNNAACCLIAGGLDPYQVTLLLGRHSYGAEGQVYIAEHPAACCKCQGTGLLLLAAPQ